MELMAVGEVELARSRHFCSVGTSQHIYIHSGYTPLSAHEYKFMLQAPFHVCGTWRTSGTLELLR